MGLERLVNFSDAVIAIAITLLVVQFSVPAANEDVADALLDRWPQFFSFILSFLMIGLFWVAHHRIFRYVARLDQVLLWINLLFLMCVAFLPYPTAVLGEHDTSRASIVFYACAVGLTGTMLAITWQYVVRAGHLNEQADPQTIHYMTRRSLVTPLAFLASIPLAFASLRLAQIVWFTPFVVFPFIRLRHKRS